MTRTWIFDLWAKATLRTAYVNNCLSFVFIVFWPSLASFHRRLYARFAAIFMQLWAFRVGISWASMPWLRLRQIRRCQ